METRIFGSEPVPILSGGLSEKSLFWSAVMRPLLVGGDETLGVEIIYRSTGLIEQGRLAIWYSGRTAAGRWLIGATTFEAALVDELIDRASHAP
jgi:hypothetical protein